MLITKEHFVEGFPAATLIVKRSENGDEVIEVRVSVKVKGRTYQARQLLSAFALLMAREPDDVLAQTEGEVIRVVRAAIQVGEKDQ